MSNTTNPSAITLSAGQRASALAIANFPYTALIRSKFQDTNGNGVRDSGEPTLAGWTIFLDANNNGVLDSGEVSTTTNSSGNFRFSNLAPGTFHVREVQQAGWTQTTANPAAITVSSG